MLGCAELMVRQEVHPLEQHSKKFGRFFPSTMYKISIMAMKLPITSGCNLMEPSQLSDLWGRRKIKHGLRF